MSFKTTVTLATVLLASLVALFPIVAQAGNSCKGVTFEGGHEARKAPTNMPADATVLQAVNLTDFAAELRAAGWSKLHLGYDSSIRDLAHFDHIESTAYSEPGHHQGNPADNFLYCYPDWQYDDVRNSITWFSRADAMEQMKRFCGSGSPLHGKVLKGPLTVKLRIQSVPVSDVNQEQKKVWWLEWGLYVEDGCEYVHDEDECIKYFHVPIDACSCHSAYEKLGGAVMNRCYFFWVWMGPKITAYNDCTTLTCHCKEEYGGYYGFTPGHSWG